MDKKTSQTETIGGEWRLFFPFLLTAAIILSDQLTKLFIVDTIPYRSIGHIYLGGFLRIIHTSNLGVIFSIGYRWPDAVRRVLFVILPIVAISLGIVYYLRSKELSSPQRWCIAGFIGGGIGNLIDRIFRPLGVVDWIDVKFYGIFGWERWPTFNIADASMVVCGILLMIILIIEERRMKRE